jgi:hypothetical protein
MVVRSYLKGNLLMTEAESIDEAALETAEQPTAPRRGRPRGSTRQPTREAKVVHRDRDGNVLTRHRQAGIDQFHIPKELIPKGYSYQWNTVTVYNREDLTVGQAMQMYENGWRPVPAERHPGRFVPVGKKGDIIRDGMRLEERPLSMTLEAAQEEEAAARRQMRDRDESLMGGKAGLARNMPEDSMNPKYRGTGGNLRMSIDPALDIPSPSLPLAEPGE